MASKPTLSPRVAANLVAWPELRLTATRDTVTYSVWYGGSRSQMPRHPQGEGRVGCVCAVAGKARFAPITRQAQFRESCEM